MDATAEQTAKLRRAVDEITAKAALQACAVAVHDYRTGWRFEIAGDRLFHAASTIKVVILLAALRAVDEGRAQWTDPILVRNRFLSVIDRTPYRLNSDSDGYPQLYRAIGRTAKLCELADTMITSSSNLATNLLLDFLGTDYAREVLRAAGVAGVHLRRGVEDEKAFDQGVNNEATANGLVQLFAVLRGEFLSATSRERAIHILLEQRFNSMIPAGLPAHATVAHKTGEISTACHDAGIVYLPEREPYILAILTEVERDANGRRETVVKISEAIYGMLTAKVAGP